MSELDHPTAAAGLLTATDLARLMQVQPCTIRDWARQGRIPAPLRLSARTHRWSVSALRDFGIDIPRRPDPQ